MSIKLMAALWDHGPEDQTELLVILALADFASDQGICWPAMATVARKARLTERGARGVVRRLAEAGWIEIQEQRGRNRTNVYRVKPEPDSGNVVPISGIKPERDDTKTGTRFHKTGTVVPPNHKEPSKNLKSDFSISEEKRKTCTKDAAAAILADVGFSLRMGGKKP